MKALIDINLKNYDYHLPEEKIARYPLQNRDDSRILMRNADGSFTHDTFKNLGNHIKKQSCMVFNNSRVIPARLIFHLPTGSSVEIFCLNPVDPSDYQLAMQTSGDCIWECMVGNKKRFKKNVLEMKIICGITDTFFRAEKLYITGNIAKIRFTWNNTKLSFAEILEYAGRTPLPPYIKRPDEAVDRNRYQTIYSEFEGSVAAPTAGLHFTDFVLESLRKNKVQMVNVTLHVGAGTFLPVKTTDVYKHDMHTEFFNVTYESIEKIQNAKGPIIAVGTTSARTLESLYWFGVRLSKQNGFTTNEPLYLQQWEANHLPQHIPLKRSLENLMNWMQNNNLKELRAYTKLMIIPGYTFRAVKALLTNFHLPKSTLLLLLAAFTGDSWKDMYDYALDHNFRFLSYGDCSLLYSQG